MIKNVLKMTHNETHFDFVKCYEKMILLYYIRDLIRYLRNYLKHCFKY